MFIISLLGYLVTLKSFFPASIMWLFNLYEQQTTNENTIKNWVVKCSSWMLNNKILRIRLSPILVQKQTLCWIMGNMWIKIGILWYSIYLFFHWMIFLMIRMSILAAHGDSPILVMDLWVINSVLTCTPKDQRCNATWLSCKLKLAGADHL